LGVDFIIGGPPCQTFSAAGRRASGVKGTTDSRGQLFEQYVRLLEHFSPQPKGFLFENVYGITGAENGEAWARIEKAFAEAGYLISWRILDAADYGVPQHRERLFIVGTKGRKFLFPRPTHGPDSGYETPFFSASRAISGAKLTEPDKSAKVNGRFGHLLSEIPTGLNYSFFTEKMSHPNPIFAWRSKFSDFLYKADPEYPIRTLKAQGGQYTGPFHWDNRPFSISELKRLQTFPDAYNIVGGKQAVIHQIGNSVPPQIARTLATAILDQLFGIKPPIRLPLLQPNTILGFRKRKRLLTQRYSDKASEALLPTTLAPRAKPPKKRSYTANITENFGWKVDDDSNCKLQVSCLISSTEWRFQIGDQSHRKDPAFTIECKPIARWSLHAEKVVLEGRVLSPKVFMGLWKAFDAELIRLGVKADVVQLCGYYQYPPAFTSNMRLSSGSLADERWDVLCSVVAGRGTRATLARQDLADALGISSQEVMRLATWLRSLGYEVRNTNTNPQIPPDHFLIPYAFPTLTPQSVQLRKSLATQNG
jgi:DNA (cytosine-5)-methyltransferase 1